MKKYSLEQLEKMHQYAKNNKMYSGFSLTEDFLNLIRFKELEIKIEEKK